MGEPIHLRVTGWPFRLSSTPMPDGVMARQSAPSRPRMKNALRSFRSATSDRVGSDSKSSLKNSLVSAEPPSVSATCR